MNLARRTLGGALAWAALTRYQLAAAQARPHRLGILEIGEPNQPSGEMGAFIDQLARLGLVEGSNLLVDRRFARRDRTQLDRLAAELVALKPDVIFTASGTIGALAAQKATTTIPIVFDASNDPVAARLVASLPRPGGNLTGNVMFGRQLDVKRLQLLVEVVSDRAHVGVLVGLTTLTSEQAQQQYLAELSAAVARSVRLKFVLADGPESFKLAFERMTSERINAVAIQASPIVSANRSLIAELAQRHRLPAIADGRGFAEAGLLLTYSSDFAELYRRAADYVARILKGATPDDLPVAYPSRFELVVNLGTAKTLGIRVPRAVLARADDVIE